MPSNDEKQLTTAIQAQFNRDNRQYVTDEVVDEIKASIIFQYSWEELLQSGPVALTSIGSCFIACASNTAQSLILEPPESGFKYLKQKSLDANLVENADLGRMAFLKAETNMGYVKQVSKSIYNKVGDIMNILMDPPTAQTQLEPYLNTIKRSADDCLAKAQEIDAKFEGWLNHALELHAACVQTQSTNSERLYATQLNMAVAQSRFANQTQAVDFARNTSEQFGKQVVIASEAYKKASDEFPNGWDILGQQIVGALAETVTTAAGQMVTAFAGNLNPVARIQSGAHMFNELIDGGKNAPANGKAPERPPPPPEQKSTSIPHDTDPAYAEIKKDILYLDLIHKVLTKGKDGGIDWDMATGADNASDNSLYVALTMLQDAKEAFEQLATREEPSTTLQNIFDTAVKVASGVQEEIKKFKEASHKFPIAESDTVKGWQKGYAEAYSAAIKLVTIARRLPGTAAGGAPLMSNNTQDPSDTIAKTNTQSAQAQAVLESAKNRMETTQQHLMATQELYIKASEQLLEQQNKLGEIQADITKLGQSQLGLQEIKDILIRCIELIVQLKQQIMNMYRFFAAVSRSIEAVVNYTVSPFIDSIRAATMGDEKRVGNFTLTDFTRSIIYQSVITIRAYYGVFGDIANMWIQLSGEHLMPGINLVDEMMLNRGDIQATQQKVIRLQAWSVEAREKVKQIAEDQRKAITETMQKRVDEIRTVTKELPPAPEARKAIEEGTKEVTKTAETAMKSNAAAAPINRFGMRPVD